MAYHINRITSEKHPLFYLQVFITQKKYVTPIFYCVIVMSMFRNNFLQSFLKNLAGGFGATLNFRKFKVALNPSGRMFLNFAKSCI